MSAIAVANLEKNFDIAFSPGRPLACDNAEKMRLFCAAKIAVLRIPARSRSDFRRLAPSSF